MTKEEIKNRLKDNADKGNTTVEIKCGYCGSILINSTIINMFKNLDDWWKYITNCYVCKRQLNIKNPFIILKGTKDVKWSKK